MPNLTSQKFPAYLTYQLFLSKAFRELTHAQRDILTLLFFEIEMVPTKKRGKYVDQLRNRYEIKLTYAEIASRLMYSDKTIWSAFKAFLAHGFLKVVKHGGGAKGDYQVYGIVEDWRKWQPGMVIRKIRENGKLGWQKTKISSTQGKVLRLPQGKPLRPKNECTLPQGKPLLLKSLDFFI